jgi:hypothetical protein
MRADKKRKQLSLPFKGLLLLLYTFSLGISLFTYCDCDVGKNWLGLVGHLLGWLHLYLLGLAAWFLPFFLGWVGWNFLTKKEIKTPPRRNRR